MAVFTAVSNAQAQSLLEQFWPGAELQSLSGISAGIENTNYFLTASLAEASAPQTWVLTLFETQTAAEVDEFVRILNGWASHGIPVPQPQQALNGTYRFELQGKPALLISKLPGEHPLTPTPAQCRCIGAWLARMHQLAPGFSTQRRPIRTLAWMRHLQRQLQSHLPTDTATRLEQAISNYETALPQIAACPQGLIHGDLFRDNALFDGDQLGGLIDFYHSCQDVLLYDLAVVANDWCFDGNNQPQAEALQALLAGYQEVRAWTSEELAAWPMLRQLAALRFWLARLQSRYLPGYQQQSQQGDKTKDPQEMEQRWSVLTQN